MKLSLTSNLTDGEKEQVEHEFKTSGLLRRRLIELLERENDSIHKAMRDVEGFDAGWHYEQASKIGQVKSNIKLISLLSN